MGGWGGFHRVGEWVGGCGLFVGSSSTKPGDLVGIRRVRERKEGEGKLGWVGVRGVKEGR